MQNKFIQETVRFLLKTDLMILEPETIETYLNGEKKECKIYMTTSYNESTHLSINPILSHSIQFSLLDAMIDQEYPALSTRSLNQKYSGLPEESDMEIILKELYRLMRDVRNALTHYGNVIAEDVKGGFSFNYTFHNTEHRLNWTKRMQQLSYSLLIYFADSNFPGGYPKAYREGFMRTLYDALKREVDGEGNLNDEASKNQPSLKDIPAGLRLSFGNRYRIMNPKYTQRGKMLEIEMFKKKTTQEKYSADYLIKIGEKEYLIPAEEMSQEGEIALNDIEAFLLQP